MCEGGLVSVFNPSQNTEQKTRYGASLKKGDVVIAIHMKRTICPQKQDDCIPNKSTLDSPLFLSFTQSIVRQRTHILPLSWPTHQHSPNATASGHPLGLRISRRRIGSRRRMGVAATRRARVRAIVGQGRVGVAKNLGQGARAAPVVVGLACHSRRRGSRFVVVCRADHVFHRLRRQQTSFARVANRGIDRFTLVMRALPA